MPRPVPPHVEPFPGSQSDDVAGDTLCRCAWKGCSSRGEYPAPKDKRLAERYMFCLDHVRAYNAQWDFHTGLSPTELEAELRDPSTWGRPTWKLGALGGGKRKGQKPWTGRFRIDDPLDLGADTAFDAKQQEQAEAARQGRLRAGSEEARALKLLGLTEPLTMEALRRRYKALVKKHHPDANGGSTEAETRTKRINAAYQTLRSTLTSTA